MLTIKYALYRSATGSYDLALDGTIVGSVLREISPDGDVRGWRAELLDDGQAEQRPPPFTSNAHPFGHLRL